MSDGTGDPNANTQNTEPASGGPSSGGPSTTTSTGLSPNMAGLLAYLLGFITGVLFLLLEKDDKYVRFHAWQSTIVFGGIFVTNIVLGMIPLLGWILAVPLVLATVLLWIVLMIKAAQGQKFKLPWVGDFAERQP